MDRPGSRAGPMSVLAASGMGKSVGAPVGQLDRPMTGSRAPGTATPSPTGSGRPPGTAMRGAAGQPPSTAYKRLGTAAGRPGTGAQGGAAGGQRTGTAVQVENRPITQHGVLGMKLAAGAGGGRKVLDRTYFVNELRQKRMEVATITQQMKMELEALEKRQAQLSQMEAHCTKLSKEVKAQQEVLADYNTVLDKVGSQTPTYTVAQENTALRERNDGSRRRVDEVLTARLALEDKARKAEARIAELQAGMDARLASLPPSQRTQYQELLAEQAALTTEAKRFDEAVEELDRQLAAQEGELARNPLKQRSLTLQDQIRQLTERKYELQQEEERGKAAPEEQREQLMARIKRDNAESEQMAGTARELQDQIKRLEARVAALSGNTPAVNAAEEAAKREKFDELVAKERDLNAFMDSFPSRRAAKMDELRARQDAIVAVLERLSKLESVAGTAMPSVKQFADMRDELEYKQMQLENTQVTADRLKEELAARRSELDKIDTLDEKIKAELKALSEKGDQLQKELEKFSQMGDMRGKAEAMRSKLEVLRSNLLRRREALRTIVADKELRHNAKRAQLAENTLHITIEKLEGKLRTVQTGIYQMREFVREKESETNYKVLAHSLQQLAEEVNAGLRRALV